MSNTHETRLTTRLAPSPTGALHLGNARTFLLNWAMARRLGWRVVLRIEDLDGPRVKSDAAEGIVRTLRWLGIDWDEGPMVQSADLTPYREALSVLAAKGLVYPSELTRAEIEAAASAPQVQYVGERSSEEASGPTGGEVRFPPELRPADAGTKRAFADVGTNWRVMVPSEPEGRVEFEDLVAGRQSRVPSASIGDFVVWTKRAQPSYQLAVVVDDARQGVTHVVRGDDLLDSAGRQLLLYRMLGLSNEPVYAHLPLVVGADGRRLAKRHGDTRVDSYRALGVPAEAIVGLIARWSGVAGVGGVGERFEMRASELVYAFDLEKLPRSAAVCSAEDHQWLLSRAKNHRG